MPSSSPISAIGETGDRSVERPSMPSSSPEQEVIAGIASTNINIA